MNKGTIYLIQPAELVGTQRYKIGCSATNDLERPRKGYKKGSRFIYIMECDNPFEVENQIKEQFNDKFKLIAGKEYFEGEEEDIKREFNNIVIQYHINIDIIKKEQKQEQEQEHNEKDEENIKLKNEKEQEKIKLKDEKIKLKDEKKQEKEQEKIKLKDEKIKLKEEQKSFFQQSSGFKITYYPCGIAVQQRFHNGSNIRYNHKQTCDICKKSNKTKVTNILGQSSVTSKKYEASDLGFLQIGKSVVNFDPFKNYKKYGGNGVFG